MVDTCAVIPVFEHGQTVGRVVDAVRNCGLHVVLVDDGSGADCARVLDVIAQDADDVHPVPPPAEPGQGRGRADAGFAPPRRSSYSHALQVDADGQHDLGDIPRLLAESRSLPDAVVCGRPVFGADAPRSRLAGRRLTNFWVSVNTWSALPDAMCGFRVYPLADNRAAARARPARQPHGFRHRDPRAAALARRAAALGAHQRFLPAGRALALPPSPRQCIDRACAHGPVLRDARADAHPCGEEASTWRARAFRWRDGMRRRGPISETIRIEVAFHDVDLMAVVWHGHYFKYLEAARWRLMDRLGYGFTAMRESGYLWPIIETHVRHVRSAAFGDRLDVTASLVEWESRLAINYLITDTERGARVARAVRYRSPCSARPSNCNLRRPPEFVRHIDSRIAENRA